MFMNFIDLCFDWVDVQSGEFQVETVAPLTNLDCAEILSNADENVHRFPHVLLGFEFGGWQLWSLQLPEADPVCPSLIYSGRHFPRGAPVTSAAFMEPSDDPRSFCYLWITWGVPLPEMKAYLETISAFGQKKSLCGSACLHQMAFMYRCQETDPVTNQFIQHYQDLIGICDRLVTYPQLNPFLRTILHPPAHKEVDFDAVFAKDCTQVDEESLMRLNYGIIKTQSLLQNRLVALIWPQENLFKISLFDLDQWYNAQMPFNIK
ncbi:Protein ELYS [Cichlidogyrus casuarinus]|uniref:Protein ELYS n=1 Tax=Cichlidogyrus casuarinus TaxID=1844966 RepID=A0ABD2QGA4_9PLAT